MQKKKRRQSEFYEQGKVAAESGDDENSCPYPPSNGASEQRIDWFNGFFDTMHNMKYAPLFERMGCEGF